MESFGNLEYPNAAMEYRGCMTKGRLKLTDTELQFKPTSKRGKSQSVSKEEIEMVNWQRLAGAWGIRIWTTNGKLHRFAGFAEHDREKLADFFTNSYGKDMLNRELSVRGWNWGNAKIIDSTISFEVGKKDNEEPAFEIPLPSVQQCNTAKNEVTLEFQANDEAAVSLSEIRFHIPPGDAIEDDPVEIFKDEVMKNASVLKTSGDAIAIIKEISCESPRGRYDLKFFPNYVHLHGKTFDYKIPSDAMIRYFFLPDPDGYQCRVTVNCDPPMKHGQTRYHYLVLKFKLDEEVTGGVELALTEEEIKEKYGDDLEKTMHLKTYEIICKMFKAVTGRKMIIPGTFKSDKGFESISCSFKAERGLLYPLEKGIIYIYKPPMYIGYDEIQRVEFDRIGGAARSFDIKVTTKQEVSHVFASIENGEYSRLYDFLKKDKGVKIVSTGNSIKSGGTKYVNTDIDHYEERLKSDAVGQESGDDRSSNDSDFNPDKLEALSAKEEYDSDPETTSSEEEDDYGSGSDAERKRDEKRKQKKEKKAARQKKREEESRDRKDRRKKKTRRPGEPKRSLSAYFIWMNENRKQIEKDNPGLDMKDVAKKAGEMWQKLEDQSEWKDRAEEDKKRYEREMEKWKAEGGGRSSKGSSRRSDKDHGSIQSPGSSSKKPDDKSGKHYRSKEFIESGDDSSD